MKNCIFLLLFFQLAFLEAQYFEFSPLYHSCGMKAFGEASVPSVSISVKRTSMQFTKIEDFLSYYSKVKKRTTRLFACIPPDKIEWSYAAGKFTIGDLIRHLACIERYMYAENVQLKQTFSKNVPHRAKPNSVPGNGSA